MILSLFACAGVTVFSCCSFYHYTHG